MLPRLKILFLCTGNTCRSQMAEAWTRALHPDLLEAYSAGTMPGRLDPRAVRVMEEAALDHHRRVRDEIRDCVAKLPELAAFREPGDRTP